MNPVKHKFLPISFVISLFGLLFSAWNVFDFTESFCLIPTSCLLFSEFAVLGISFWWFGIVFFMFSLILALFGLVYFGKLLAGIGLIFDFFLLCVMLYTVPCINCLIVGLSIALVYISFLYEERSLKSYYPKLFLVLPWFIVFTMICGSIIMSYAKPWTISGDNSADIHIYFSTKCSACTVLIEAQGDKEGIAWYPVQQDSDDIWQVKLLQDEIEKGASFGDAYLKMRATAIQSNIYDVFSWDHWLLQLKLWKNAAYLMKTGHQRLPFVEFNGLPSVLLEKVGNTKTQDLSNQSSSIDGNKQNVVSSLLGGVEGFCGGEAEPCPELAGDNTGKDIVIIK